MYMKILNAIINSIKKLLSLLFGWKKSNNVNLNTPSGYSYGGYYSSGGYSKTDTDSVTFPPIGLDNIQ